MAKPLKLYRLTLADWPQNYRAAYNYYDSVVVCAESEEDALTIDDSDWKSTESPWDKPDNIIFTYLGEAAPGIPKGVILESFNQA